MAKKRSAKAGRRSGASGSSNAGSAAGSQPNLNNLDEQDRKAVAEAIRKRSRGEELTVREQQALKRLQNRQDEAQRERLYTSMPKADYVRLSGRTHRVLQDQAQRYGIPLNGRTIRLGEVLKRFHDLIAQMRGRFGSSGEDEQDPLLQGAPSDALERYRLAKARTEEHKLEQLRGRLVDRDDLLRALGPIFERIRLTGETLQREFGTAAHQLLDDALSESERDLDNLFNHDSSSNQPDSQTDAGSDPAGESAARQDDA